MSFNIPKYTDFIKDKDLLEKVPNDILESYNDFISSDDAISEGVMDTIKNTLSKTLLGGLSYISMIDKGLEGIFNLKKDLINKNDKAEREIADLEKIISALERSKNPERLRSEKDKITTIKNTLAKEEKVIELKIEKGEKMLDDIIKGNKRRREYFEAKESDYSVKLAEYDLAVAKKKANPDQSEIKELQKDVEEAKQEAQRNAEDLKDSMESEKKDKEKEEGEKDIFAQIEETEKKMAEKKSALGRAKSKDLSKMSEKNRTEMQRKIDRLEVEYRMERAYLKKLNSENKKDDPKSPEEIKKEVEKEIKGTMEKSIQSDKKGKSDLTPAQREKSAR